MGAVVEWITAEAACERLGKCSKTLERLVVTNEIETRMEPVPGRKPRRLFYAPAIERLADETEARKRERLDGLTSSPTILEKEGRALLEQIASAFRRLPPLPEPETAVRPKAAPIELWLTLEQAANYSGLGRSDLKNLGKSSTIRTRRSGRSILYQRQSLEDFSRT